MSNMTFQEKYSVIGTQDPTYEGIFITGVKSTGIFCRPSCRARKPKAENVIFFETSNDALQHGFRPCKVCTPMSKMGETPEYIKEVIEELHQNPYLRIKDSGLRERGIEPSHIRRWFKKHHQMTFHTYQRLLRINAAFSRIDQGESVTQAAFDSGYKSLSGFNERYRSIFGEAPTDMSKKEVIKLIRFTTPIGPMFAGATDKGLCLLEFTDRRMLETEFKDLQNRLKAVILPGETAILSQTQEELGEYFEGKRKYFSVPLDTPGTPFQQSVWKVLGEMIKESKDFEKDLNVKLIGKCAQEVYRSVEEFELHEQVEYVNYMPHEEVLKYQRSSQVLLLSVNKVPSAKSIITGKVFEYMQSKRPIIGIGTVDGDLSLIMKKTKAGVVVDFDDASSLKSLINELYIKFKDDKLEVESIDVDRYHRKNLTKNLVEILKNI